MTTEPEETGQKFHVIPFPPKWAFDDNYVQGNLQKWDILEGSNVCRYRFEKRNHKLAAEEFLMSFFNDETVQSTFKVMASGKEWVPIGPITSVECEVVPANLVSMEFFDRYENSDPPVVREGLGTLVKRMDDVVQGFTVQDMLRESLLCEDSELAELFSEEDKEQLLYCMHKNLALGGPMCQFEESLEPYLETTKRLYKSLLSVQKNAASGNVDIISVVYRVRAVGSENWTLFPKDSIQNWCYVYVDVLRRQCTVWYHAQMSYW